MRNLSYSTRSCQVFPELSECSFVLPQSVFDGETRPSFLAFKSPTLYRVYPNEFSVLETLDADEVAGGFYTDQLTLVTPGGDLVTSTDRLSFHGVESAAPNVNQEVALVGDGLLTLLSPDLVATSTHVLDNESEVELVSVGWGKKETQFQGSLGKGAAKAEPEPVEGDRDGASFTWSHDGDFIAVSYWSQRVNMRRIKVFKSDGTLEGVTKDITGLCRPMAWKPGSRLIAVLQNLPNKTVIAFIERNGLKHSELPIPQGLKVISLSWSEDATILCVHGEEDDKELLQLWTMSNYHWYMKKVIPLPTRLVGVIWSEDSSPVLSGLCSDGTVFCVCLYWAVSKSEAVDGKEAAFVGVIDAKEILLTSCQKGIVPPPMSTVNITCPSPVLQLLFSPQILSTQYDMVAVLLDGSLALYSLNDLTNPQSVILKATDWPHYLDSALATWSWTKGGTLYAVGPCIDNASLIRVFKVEETLDEICSLTVPHPILGVGGYHGDLILCHPNGSCDVVSESTVSTPPFSFPEGVTVFEEGHLGLFALTPTHKLYREGALVSRHITSFALRSEYLLVTLPTHKIAFFKTKGDTLEEVSSRTIERGSWLVTTFEDVALLQHPRGNLEAIRPRPLSLLRAASLLDRLMYKEVALLLRRERINYNLIVDHDPQQFVDNIPLFAKEVPPEWINIFISELSNDDVTKTTYALYYPQASSKPTFENKVERIMELLRAAVSDWDAGPGLTTLVSSYAKTGDYARAVHLASTKDALKHLFCHVLPETLYKATLKAYDLEAAFKVASASQMDPKEYISQLNHLSSLPEFEMKATIDLDQNDYSGALKHLAAAGLHTWDDAFELIKKHSLFWEGLSVFSDQPDKCKAIAGAFADSLFDLRSYQLSGVFFEKAELFDKASVAYTRSLDWRRAIVTSKLAHSEDQTKELAKSLIALLSAQNNYKEAAEIASTILNDQETLFKIYVKGKLWKEALYVSSSQEEIDKIKTSLLESIEGFTKSLKSVQDLLYSYTTRLEERKNEDKQGPVFYDEFTDSASDASSTSGGSLRTSSTSRSRKKANRKAWSLKKGSAREKEALTKTIYDLFEGINQNIDEFSSLSDALLHLGDYDKAKEIESAMKSFLSEVKRIQKKVWCDIDFEDEISAIDHRLKYPPHLKPLPRCIF